MSTPLTDLRTRVLHMVPRCPAALIDQTILDVVRGFCEKTRIWQEQIPDLAIEKDQKLYCLDLDDDVDGEIYQIEQVRINANPETLNTEGDVVRNVEYLVQHTDDGVWLKFNTAPSKTIDSGLIVTVSVRPKLTSTSFPTTLYNDYYRGWAGGTLAELFSMPDKRWSASAGYLQTQRWEYEQAIRRGMEDLLTLHTSRDLIMTATDRGPFQLI